MCIDRLSCCRPCRTVIGRRGLLRLLAGAGTLPLVGGCDERDGFPIPLVSDETVRRLGLESWERLRAEIPASSDRELQQTLSQVARHAG